MIVYYVVTGHSPAKVVKFTGNVTFAGKDIVLHDSNTYFSHTRKQKVTIFDDSTVPPTLIRDGYDLDELRELGAALPDSYIDKKGNICNASGKIIFSGPGFSYLTIQPHT